MFRKLKERWLRFVKARRLAREVAPATFLSLSAELRELAEAVSKIRHETPGFQPRLERIIREMSQLEELASKPEFKRLSTAKRLELRNSLLSSRRQLLESMQAAPPPTDRLQ